MYVKLAGPHYLSDRTLPQRAMTEVEQLEHASEELTELANRLDLKRDRTRAETDAVKGANRR